MESQPQNPEFRNNPENFPPCFLLVFKKKPSHKDGSFEHPKHML